jgi:chromosome segregation ATPase
MLIVGILISVSTFSQTISKPIVLKDSTGITLLAFNEEQVITIIKSLKENNINKKLIKELENQIGLLRTNNNLLLTERDTLKEQIKTFIEVKITLKEQVSVKQQKIEELESIIANYQEIETNLNTEVALLKDKIKKKNGWIGKLITTNIITGAILIFILL